ncbi:MAG TPA: PAS-domain containing protein [Xanthobacteraceae bacterium]|jgi:signal transduction histidine kinase
MPDMIRAKGGSLKARLRSCRLATTASACALSAAPTAAGAEDAAGWPFDLPYLTALTRLDPHESATLALILGVLFFAVVTAILLVRTRARAGTSEAAARDRIAALQSDVDRLTGLLLSDPHIVVSWLAASDEPDILGETADITENPDPAGVLAFGAWLGVDDARAMERAVERLRSRGEGFNRSLTTSAGRRIEVEGRAIAGRAVMKLRDVGGIERKLTELNTAHEALKAETDSLRFLIDAMPSPVWVRDASGELVFANAAYAHAVDAADGVSAVALGSEMVDRAGRVELERASAVHGAALARLPVVVAGRRRSLDVLELATPGGRAGIAIDATDTETLRAELARLAEAHRRTLDQLATGVATFGADRKLAFTNAAYRSLWGLDAGFLDQQPTDSSVLDRLRNDRKLPEQQDFRQWKTQLHEAYRAAEARAHEWHLPDGRTLRVVTTPHPQGGVTYLFDDVTERLDLERRFDALISVQGETLDNLAEALAVFGSDGRVRLFNPAFARMWRIDPAVLHERPHIETVIELCRPLHGDTATWQRLRTAVTALEQRDPVSLRIERTDGSVADCATVPLPDGGTLVAFQNVTDSVNVERALRERNEALVAADETKVNFVHHVSYELRSPLTNIIGFAEFLNDPVTGPMTERQREYLGYITVSTNSLLALINNILDLASIDAGAMTLNLGAVDIHRTMAAAAEGIQDRLVKDGITLDIRAGADIGSFIADERRVRQVLFNLLSNAVGFSPPGAAVTLAAERTGDVIVFSVTDRGPGIPADMQDRVFEWFETHSLGSQHRGPGLGLSLVRSFVQLHGGRVEINSAVGRGTTVVCTFPLEQAARRTAA